MTLPLLQLALDETDLEKAIKKADLLAPEVDVLEAGTLLVCSVGMAAVRTLRQRHPDHLVVSDIKAADAGGLLANICFGAGADWMTVICCAPLPTIQSALEAARKLNSRGDIQIELFGDWTWGQAQQWRSVGITQAIYHRGRDAQAAGQGWEQSDIDRIAKLADMGFGVSVTGGITPADLGRFQAIPVKAFIAGRALSDAPDPIAAAKTFKQGLQQFWG